VTQGGRTVIDEVKARLDIVDVVGSKVELQRAGRAFKGLCPFHQEKTPSFTVNPERQSYHCFGCGKGGDIISFVMDTDGLDFKEALRGLAAQAGVRIEEPKARRPEVEDERKRLLGLNRLAARYFNSLLLTADSAAGARKYLEGRGIERPSWEAWTLGYAPNSWDATLKYLRGKGYSAEEVGKAGLAVERTGGGQYDRFRERVIFPIRDREGEFVAFGGRAMGDGHPKYLNSPESPVFTKGEHLYGLDLAQAAVKEAGRVVVVEGYVDAVVAHAHGFANVVATLGTALTPAQVRLLSRLTRNVCLALDADAAGDAAALRGWEVLRDAVRSRHIPIKSRGRVVASERQSDLNVRIARLPRGEDPDTLIRKAPQEWQRLIEGARSVVDHFFEVAREGADLATPEGRTRVVGELAPVIADIGNPIERAHYEAQLGSLVGLDEHEIHSEVARSRRAGPARPQAAAAAPLRQVSPEELLLALLLRYPRLLEDAPPTLPEELERSEHRETYTAMRELGAERLTAETLLAAAPEPLRPHIEALTRLVESQPELLRNEQPEELRLRLAAIRRKRLRDLMHQHTLLLREASEMGDEAGVRALLAEAPTLASEVREFDPPKSPYFKDSRES
jgi:DNA primase